MKFTALVEDFFGKYLIAERDLSRNTLLSYRDALKLLFSFMSTKKRRSPDRLTLDDFDAESVRAFLDWLISERRSSNRTVNQRLAAVKAFFRFIATRIPEQIDRCRSIRDIRNRRVDSKVVGHLDVKERKSLLEAAGRTGRLKERNAALITLMLNTGARVQELVDLDVENLRLDETPKVRIRGKGRKHRDCPLWKSTVSLLRRWLEVRCGEPNGPLFLSERRTRMSRSGIAYVVRCVAKVAGIKASTDREQVTPHHLRHTTAMDLLRSRADVTVVAAWLGHATLQTTHQYVEIDLKMKQAAIAEAHAVVPESIPADPPSPQIIQWLDSLKDYVQTPGANPFRPRALRERLRITEDST